jgi:hypothetical protein
MPPGRTLHQSIEAKEDARSLEKPSNPR